jgi:hypothetical protein
MDPSWDWAAYVVALSLVLIYIRNWRNEHVRARALTLAAMQGSQHTDRVLNRAELYERYIREGKDKTIPSADTVPPPPPPPPKR